MARGTPPEQRRVVAPRLPADLGDAVLPRDRLGDDAMLEALVFDRLGLAGSHARLVDIEGCRFTSTSWSGSDLDKVVITDSELVECDLATLRLEHSSLTRTRLRGCRMTGFVAPGAMMRQVLFEECLLDMASLRCARLDHVELRDCQVRQADLGGADLGGATFVRCDLTNADLSNASAQGAVFVDCTWDDVRGVASLAGARVAHTSPADGHAFMVALAGAVGVRLIDSADVNDARTTGA